MITKYRLPAPFAHPFNEFFGGTMGRDISQFIGRDDIAHSSPKVNITESPEKYVISLLVPGSAKDQISVTTEKDTITIKGENTAQPLAEHERYTRREFQFGGFSRSFQLPGHVDLETITADHVNGVLHIHIPRVVAAKPAARSITIA